MHQIKTSSAIQIPGTDDKTSKNRQPNPGARADAPPCIYSGNMTGESVMHWLQEQKMESQIRQVTGQMMHRLVENAEYVVAMFLKDCDRSVEVKLQGVRQSMTQL